MNNPIKIIVKSEMLTLEGIKQYYIHLKDDTSKIETIKDLFKSISFSQTIIYCNSINRVKDLFSEAPIQTPPLGNTPTPIVQAARVNVDPNTNLTRTQTALLSPEEQVIASRRT